MSAVVVITPHELEQLIESAVERALARQSPAPAPPKPTAGLLDRQEVQERLSISRSTLYELRRRKKLQPVYLGPRQVRYRSEDVERLAQNGLATP